ncbi:unnamed protein product [Psylliodes chrysocephalus]|uniref:Peptide transporter n=1 Tax=Psylliodes chrysocephalus TaxID=3402493 RepID=A0A9P0G6Y4_9CUCU|nr:unnamed protein product [Psylliodes chrysocephala]
MEHDSTYPTAVFCIIATEFCERFSFCGLRTILSLYLRNILLFSENAATVIYHIFIMVCYIIPMVGAFCADIYFGRYRTIRNFAIIYLIGNILMCVAAVPTIGVSPTLFSAIGLSLIAIGTGGIKPCVAAFGAEQFTLPAQKDMLMHFFSIFYFTINLGGFVGMTLTPIMKKAVTCFGEDTCYALGFGFPAALMLMAISTKFKERTRSDHWLDKAKGKFNTKLIEDMKVVCAILLLYTPLPIFWSLFDQQGSRWTFQLYNPFNGVQIINASELFRFKNVVTHNYSTFSLRVEAPYYCGDCYFSKHTFDINILSVEHQVRYINE